MIKDANHGIEVTIPYKSVRAENERFPLVPQLLFLPNIVLEVQEGDFLSGIDGLIDTVNDQINALVIVFHTVFRGNVPLQVLGLGLAGHLRKPGHQLLALLRDELGCFHSIDQRLKKIAALLHQLESFADAS